jgi:hypothetical protein
MCPACLTSAVLIAAGSGLSGGLAVVLARSVRRIASLKALANEGPIDMLAGATRGTGNTRTTPTNGGRDTR